MCRTCVQEYNAKSECQHRSDAERCLEGTWVIDEMRLAVDKGHKIVEILEVYEYQVTWYDPETGNGGKARSTKTMSQLDVGKIDGEK